MAYLALVRHGQSQWNKAGLWTGLTDISLTPEGIKEAQKAGELLKEKDIFFDYAFTSKLKRAQETLYEIKMVLGQDFPTEENTALNEKDYGDFTGKNKWEIKEKVGEKEFLKIRRSWDYQLPHGESLKDVYDRTIPYYKKEILPKLEEGKNVIVASHGNTLRALIKYLDDISDKDIPELEMVTAEVRLYTINEKGEVIKKEILNQANTTRKPLHA